MSRGSDVRTRVADALAEVVDPPLLGRGFQRPAGSLTYSRMSREAEQRVSFFVEPFPGYQEGAEAHIQPAIQISMPKVTERALLMVEGDRMLLAGAPGIVVNQPIEFAAPKEDHRRWFVAGSEAYPVVCASIRDFLLKWSLPLLDQLTTASDLVAIYERDDDRLVKQRHWYVFVAAAYQLLGRSESAREVVQRHFSAPGVRRRYGALLASVGLD